MNNYSIKGLSTATGIPTQTIRTWERRYQVFKPARDENDQRVYGHEDLIKAKYLAELVKNGLSISKIAHLDLEALKNQNETIKYEKDLKWSKLGLEKIYKSIIHYNIDEIILELEHLRFSFGVKDYILEVILPIMAEIGKRVELKKLSVTQEHLISTIIRDQISQIHLPNNINKKIKLAVATPEGNLHELPIIMANVLCKYYRIKTYYLGASHPADCLADAINNLNIDAILLGSTQSPLWDYRNKIIPYLAEIDKNLKTEVEVLIGGGTPFTIPEFKNIKKVNFLTSFEQLNKYLAETF